MPKHRRTQNQRDSDREMIDRLRKAGRSGKEIANELGLSKAQVSRELRIFQSERARDLSADLSKLRNKELARIDCMEASYWRAWEASIEPAIVTSQEKTATKNGGSEIADINELRQAGQRTAQRDGNPAFLRGVMDCIKKRCKLLGLYPRPGERVI